MSCWHRHVGALLLATGLVVLAAPSGAARQPVDRHLTKIQVADGVYLFRSPNYGDVGLDGNSVVIISRDGVLVFDTNGTPAAAEAVLSEIRAMTNQPVRYVVNSHWHWDHWYGTEVYQRAFPDARIIAHQKTRDMMMGPALAFNQPGLDNDLPAYIASLEHRRADAASAGKADEAAKLGAVLDEDRRFLDQKRAVHHTFPNLTFTDQLDLHMGERLIQVRDVDRAVTPGDAFLYLPNEKVLITGDLLVNPVTFALSCYPAGWLRTLERLETLEASIIVPGHGAPLNDKQLLHDTEEVLRILIREGTAARKRGVDVDDAKTSILASIAGPMGRITKGDPAVTQAFTVQLVDWCLHRVYEEPDGPLSDAIAPIPRR